MTLNDLCPLGCGRPFHGLPKEATTWPTHPDRPGPWDATPKAPEEVER